MLKMFRCSAGPVASGGRSWWAKGGKSKPRCAEQRERESEKHTHTHTHTHCFSPSACLCLCVSVSASFSLSLCVSCCHLQGEGRTGRFVLRNGDKLQAISGLGHEHGPSDLLDRQQRLPRTNVKENERPVFSSGHEAPPVCTRRGTWRLQRCESDMNVSETARKGRA